MIYKDLTRSTNPWWQAKTPTQANETAKQIIEKVAEEVNPELAKKCKKAQQQVNQANSLSMESLSLKYLAQDEAIQKQKEAYYQNMAYLKGQQWISLNNIKADPNVPQNAVYIIPDNITWSGTTTGGTIPAAPTNPYWTGGNVPTPSAGQGCIPKAGIKGGPNTVDYSGPPDDYNEPNLPEPISMADIYKPDKSTHPTPGLPATDTGDWPYNKPSPIQQLLNNGDAGDGKATQYYTQYKWKGNNVTAAEYNELIKGTK